MKTARYIISLPALVLIASVLIVGCSKAPKVATSMTAHLLCSETFVAERDTEEVFQHYIRRIGGLRQVSPGLKYALDQEAKEVEVRLFGGSASVAAHASGRGCTVLNDSTRPRPNEAALQDPQPEITPQHSGLPMLERALDDLMQDTDQAVKAIVILQDGKILSERYAAGMSEQTPMLSWSVAKSVVNALIGILVRDGKVELHTPAPVRLWADPKDPRHNVSIDQLLRQTSGQPFGAANTGFDPASQMLFLSADTAARSASATFAEPGTRWSYTDGNYAILSGILRDVIGGRPGDITAFAKDELFGPVGMHSAVMEFDQAGAPMGAAFIYATARDWARFGQLYLDNGTVGSRRILPDSWVTYSTTSTPLADGGYGAGFWVNDGPSHGARQRRKMGAPAGSYFASGNFGQVVLVVPSQRLVIARFSESVLPAATTFGATVNVLRAIPDTSLE